jgi:hypothetical protein
MSKHKKQADLKTLLGRRKMTVQTLMTRRALTTREELVAWCPLNGIEPPTDQELDDMLGAAVVPPPPEKKAAKKPVQKKKSAVTPTAYVQPKPAPKKPEPEVKAEEESAKKHSTGSTRM